MNKTELDLLIHEKDKDGIDYWSDETRQAMRELADQYGEERRQAMIEVGELPTDPLKASVSTAEVIRQFLDYNKAAGLQPHSIQSYGQALSPFAREFPTLPATQQEIEGFLGNKPSGATRLWVYKVLTVFYKFANKRFGVPNIMAKMAKPRVKPKEPVSLTKNQAKMLLDAIETDRERGLVYLYLGQALRLSEALRLDIRDIGEDLLHIKGKERDESMPLLPEVRDALLKLAGERDYSQPVFFGQQGRLGRDMAEENVRRLFKRAGVNGVKQSPHTLRHTFASLATAAGCDTFSVERLLRHRSSGRNVTHLYIHLTGQELREKLERYSPLRLIMEQGQDSDKPVVGGIIGQCYI